jgi:hypothetical protein
VSDETPRPLPTISDAIAKAVDDTLASRPKDKRVTVRLDATVQNGKAAVVGGVAVSLRDSWELGVWGAAEPGNYAAGVRVQGSW